jgi:uncharacterized membrane protein
MTLEPLLNQPSPIPAHAIAAMLAIVVGAIQFALPKGTSFHKYLGYTWVSLMAIISISSFWIHEIRLIGAFSPIHLLSIFTLISIVAGVQTARLGNIKRHQLIMKSLYFWALIVTGAFTFLPNRVMFSVITGG